MKLCKNCFIATVAKPLASKLFLFVQRERRDDKRKKKDKRKSKEAEKLAIEHDKINGVIPTSVRKTLTHFKDLLRFHF